MHRLTTTALSLIKLLLYKLNTIGMRPTRNNRSHICSESLLIALHSLSLETIPRLLKNISTFISWYEESQYLGQSYSVGTLRSQNTTDPNTGISIPAQSWLQPLDCLPWSRRHKTNWRKTWKYNAHMKKNHSKNTVTLISFSHFAQHQIVITAHKIIPHINSQLTFKQAHFSTFHDGTQLTLGFTRRSSWIVGGRPMKSCILHCVVGARQRGIRAHQHGPTTSLKSYTHTSVTYAGPIIWNHGKLCSSSQNREPKLLIQLYKHSSQKIKIHQLKHRISSSKG